MKYCGKCKVEMPDNLDNCIQCGCALDTSSITDAQSDPKIDPEKRNEWLSEQTKIKSELQDLISRVGGDEITDDIAAENTSTSQADDFGTLESDISKSFLETSSSSDGTGDDKNSELKQELEDLRSEGYIVTRLENAINSNLNNAWKIFTGFLNDIEKLNVLKSKLENINPSGYELQVEQLKSKLNNPDLVGNLEKDISELERLAVKSELETSVTETALEKEPAEETLTRSAEPESASETKRDRLSDEHAETKKLEELIESGKSAFRVSDLVKAIEYMDSALLIDPDNKEVQFFKKKILTKLSESTKSDKRIRAAQDEIGAIAGEEPLESWDEIKSKSKKGKKKKGKKEKVKAKKETEKTRSATELEALGFNAFINKNYKKALKYYKNVIAQDPDFPGVKARIKDCKDKLGKK